MEFSLIQTWLLASLVFLVAALYSSVGHGGASGYLAILSLFAVPPAQMATTALTLNVLVAGIAAISYVRAGHFSLRLFWPFAVTSIPLAFAGGLLTVSDPLYYFLLAVALMVAAIRLFLSLASAKDAEEVRQMPFAVALPVGGSIGLLSGIVGVGGGIFLSPVMLLLKWATAKQTAATAAVFILVNSLAGLGARVVRSDLYLLPAILPLAAAFTGGLLGSYWGAKRFSSLSLRRALALVLAFAAIKLILRVF